MRADDPEHEAGGRYFDGVGESADAGPGCGFECSPRRELSPPKVPSPCTDHGPPDTSLAPGATDVPDQASAPSSARADYFRPGSMSSTDSKQNARNPRSESREAPMSSRRVSKLPAPPALQPAPSNAEEFAGPSSEMTPAASGSDAVQTGTGQVIARNGLEARLPVPVPMAEDLARHVAGARLSRNGSLESMGGDSIPKVGLTRSVSRSPRAVNKVAGSSEDHTRPLVPKHEGADQPFFPRDRQNEGAVRSSSSSAPVRERSQADVEQAPGPKERRAGSPAPARDEIQHVVGHTPSSNSSQTGLGGRSFSRQRKDTWDPGPPSPTKEMAVDVSPRFVPQRPPSSHSSARRHDEEKQVWSSSRNHGS